MATIKELYAQPKNYKIQEKINGVWVWHPFPLMRKFEAQSFVRANKIMRGTSEYKELRIKKRI